MTQSLTRALALFAVVATTLLAHAQERPFERTIDLVYLNAGGTDYYMDIFVPSGKGRIEALKPNDNGKGLGIVDIGSGAWHSDRGKLDDHETAKMYDIFTARGYTVFACRPGSRGENTCFDMVDHVKAAIRWVKANAAKYNIDPERLGLCGASAGGHLALMTILSEEPADPSATDPLKKFSTKVAAAGIFFPPTDFVNWGAEKNPIVKEAIGDILFKGGADGHSEEEVNAMAKKASPLYMVKEKTIPVVIYHGDADPVVPLSQSEKIVAKLKAVGSDVEFNVVPGGTHPWITIPLDVIKMADWFDKKLAAAAK